MKIVDEVYSGVRCHIDTIKPAGISRIRSTKLNLLALPIKVHVSIDTCATVATENDSRA